MDNVSLDGIITLLLEGIDKLAFGADSKEQFVSSLLASTSSFDPVPSYEDAKSRFERASTYAHMLMGSDKHQYPVNPSVVIAHLRHLVSIVNYPATWCKSVLEAETATDNEKSLALSTYESFTTGVGRLNEVIKAIREKRIHPNWNPSQVEPPDLPDVPTPITLNG